LVGVQLQIEVANAWDAQKRVFADGLNMEIGPGVSDYIEKNGGKTRITLTPNGNSLSPGQYFWVSFESLSPAWAPHETHILQPGHQEMEVTSTLANIRHVNLVEYLSWWWPLAFTMLAALTAVLLYATRIRRQQFTEIEIERRTPQIESGLLNKLIEQSKQGPGALIDEARKELEKLNQDRPT
jgi:hypothetical protein